MTKASRFDPIEMLCELIAFPSVSARSNDEVSARVAEWLNALGFQIEQVPFTDAAGVPKNNLVARRDPVRGGAGRTAGLAYFCHTDVVPADHWTGPGGDPFAAVADEQRLYGRGACDMKGSLAAMLAAVAQVPVTAQTAPLWIVCTADEEVGFGGAHEVIARSQQYRELVSAQPLSIIGEPTELHVVHAHKGICGFQVTSHGRAAHSSTAAGLNANHALVPMLQTMLELGQQCEQQPRYRDPRFDPPTLSWNFGIREGGSAVNITPERAVAWVTFRPMPEIDGKDLLEAARTQAAQLGLDFDIFVDGQPLWMDPDAEPVRALCRLAGDRQPRTVCFGTDGGEFAQLQQRVVWGPGSIEQAHRNDEWISREQLERGTQLYTAAIRQWCG